MTPPPEARMKTAVATGASAGVGRAIALARRGWRVALIARSLDGLESAKSEIESEGGVAIVLAADVSDHAAVSAAADKIVRRYGVIDVWVNDAMVTAFAPIADLAASTGHADRSNEFLL